MHIFVTGGSRLTGPAIVAELIAAGPAVTGLARSDESATRLEALGAWSPGARRRTSTVFAPAPKRRTG